MRIGYNTNGFAHHELLDAIDLLARLGFQSVAITLDHHALNPFSAECSRQVEQVRERLERYDLSSVVETGARYLLDSSVKHEPTLVSPLETARERRIEFLRRAIDIAEDLQSDCVSCWSGVVRDGASQESVWNRLIPGLMTVLDHADRRGVAVGFEPEPGMFIDTMARFDELSARIARPQLQLTVDVGHLHCQGETPIADHLHRWGEWIVNVHLEDMRAGVHEHLMFGEGEIEFPPVIAALNGIRYQGGLHVELSRHSHEAPIAAQKSYDFLQTLLDQTG